jgi:glycosyltransferase involved in cell wall biosynthesis
MIVRNEHSNLPTCLSSAAGLFDEIVVVDTGSTDRTREIAQGFGVRVFEFVWVDDIAAARNTALGQLRQSLSRSAPTDSITRKLFALIARCHSRRAGTR